MARQVCLSVCLFVPNFQSDFEWTRQRTISSLSGLIHTCFSLFAGSNKLMRICLLSPTPTKHPNRGRSCTSELGVD